MDSRPIHADEATGARILAVRLANASYQFDPSHFHGPLLTLLAKPWCQWLGQNDWASLQLISLRQVTALAGLLTILGIAAFRMGFFSSLFAMSLVATSPLLVYYARDFIHEPIFLLAAIPSLAGLLALLKNNRSLSAGLLFGIGLGLMAATRETVVISLFVWFLTSLRFLYRQSLSNHHSLSLRIGIHRAFLPLLIAASAPLLVIFLTYSSGGQHPSGFFDFFKTYVTYTTTPGHEKPFTYYFSFLVWPSYSAGLWWSEAPILLLALTSYLGKPNDPHDNSARFFCDSGLLHLLIYSFIAYKTPWLAALGWLHLCIAAGYSTVALVHRLKPRYQYAFIPLLVCTLFWQGLQAHRAAFRLASDGRNPYAYVPTSKDVLSLSSFLNQILAVTPHDQRQPVAVIGNQYWPLPWYLRELNQSPGYWDHLSPDQANLPLLILLPSAFDQALPLLQSSHTFIPRGLRDEAPLFIAIRNDIWSNYQQQ